MDTTGQTSPEFFLEPDAEGQDNMYQMTGLESGFQSGSQSGLRALEEEDESDSAKFVAAILILLCIIAVIFLIVLAVIVFQRKPEKMDVATETERIYEYFPVVNFTSSVSAASTAGTTKALAPATTRAPSTTHSTMTTVATETTSGSTTETTTETTTATISETMTITTIANTPTSTTPKCHKGGPLTPCDVDDSIDQPKTYRLTSPGYATGHYNSNICHRTCIIANACFLRINAISFKMEPRNPSGECNDYFEFFNEGNGAPGSQVHTGPVCGSESIPADGGQGGRLQFVFHSNDVIEEAGYDLELVFTQGPDPQVDGTCGTIGPG